MAGNNVYVQGNYIDVHDNEIVNLNIDKAMVSVETTAETADGPAQERAAVLTENAEFMAIMAKAVEAGFCTRDGWQYKWNVKVEAAYFASVASQRFNLSSRRDHDGDLAISWKPFEALFGEKGFRSKFNDYQQGKIKLRHKEEIDKLFR